MCRNVFSYLASLVPSSLSEVAAFLSVELGSKEGPENSPQHHHKGQLGHKRLSHHRAAQSTGQDRGPGATVSCPSKPPGSLNGQDSLGPVLGSIF